MSFHNEKFKNSIRKTQRNIFINSELNDKKKESNIMTKTRKESSIMNKIKKESNIMAKTRKESKIKMAKTRKESNIMNKLKKESNIINKLRKESNIANKEKKKLIRKSTNMNFIILNKINKNIRDDSAVLNNPDQFYNGLFHGLIRKYTKANYKPFQK